MEERELVSLIENEVRTSIGGSGGGSGSSAGAVIAGSSATTSRTTDLATERALELDYYNSQPFGNEREGESQVVSSDVFDAVEGMLPHLIKTFTASDDAVEFDPEGEEDEEAARQRTDACNYVFYRQNNGFLVAYEWFKDALMQKNGVVKYWWEEKSEVSEDEYQGLTEGEYLTLKQDDSVEVLEEKGYDDPEAVAKKQQMLQKIQSMPPMPPRPQIPGQSPPPNPQMLMAQIQAAPIPQLYDCKVRITEDKSKVCIKAIPPEEFGISSKHNCISIQDTPFCYHRTRMTISALREQGCPDEVIERMGTADQGSDNKPEVLARTRFIDEARGTNDGSIDPSSKEVSVVECFLRVDHDGDGKAELRHIIMPGRAIWINEKTSHINFAALTPIIMPHRWIGKSIAELVMDIQFNKSVLKRQTYNNLYLSNNPQKVVLGSQGGIVQADLDRLMTSRVGGILVEYQPNAIRNQEVPFVAGASYQMIEYEDACKENRVGITRYNQGTDANTLNKTAHGIEQIMNAAQQKMDLVARIFAETGVKDLFRGIAYFLSKYSTKKMTLRLRNQWVDIDPREWKTQFDMTVNVGLGTGNKDAQLAHLAKMNEVQIELMKEGRGYMVTDQNIYNLSKKMAENMGFKHPDLFLTDPSKVQKPPPAPNPDILKLQQADSEAKMKIQSNEKIRQFDAQTQKEIESIRAQATIQVEQMRIASQQAIKKAEMEHAGQLAIFSANAAQKPTDDPQIQKDKLTVDWEKAKLAAAKDIEVAQIASKTTLSAAALKAEADAAQAASEALAVKSETDSGNGKIHQAIASLAEAQVATARASKTPRTHKIKKTPDGYEITSTQAS